MTEKSLETNQGKNFSPQMLHSFTRTGYLPPGIHSCTLESLAAIVCFNDHRRKMWAKLTDFLSRPAFSDKFSFAYLGGGYVSIKPNPRDIDLVLQTEATYGPDSFAALTPFFVTGLDRIADLYGVHLHFWMDGAPESLNDFRTFFQYRRNGETNRRLDPNRGIVRINLHDPKVLGSLRELSQESAQASCNF